MGSALMLMLWLVLMERPEPADLQTVRWRGKCYCCELKSRCHLVVTVAITLVNTLADY